MRSCCRRFTFQKTLLEGKTSTNLHQRPDNYKVYFLVGMEIVMWKALPMHATICYLSFPRRSKLVQIFQKFLQKRESLSC